MNEYESLTRSMTMKTQTETLSDCYFSARCDCDFGREIALVDCFAMHNVYFRTCSYA